MITGIIYEHRNKNNGKIYIGQTTQKPEYRWNHGEGYKDSELFYNAIKKYGWENFDHIILEQNVPKAELNEREIYWIKYFHSDDRKYGYNLTSGGFSSLSESQRECKKQKLQEWRDSHPEQAQKSIKAMQEYWKLHPQEKKAALAKATQKSSEYWKAHPEAHKERMQKMQEAAKKKNIKPVRCIETGIVYESAREADRQTHIPYYNIGKACHGRTQTAGKLHWEFYRGGGENEGICKSEKETDE